MIDQMLLDSNAKCSICEKTLFEVDVIPLESGLSYDNLQQKLTEKITICICKDCFFKGEKDE